VSYYFRVLIAVPGAIAHYYSDLQYVRPQDFAEIVEEHLMLVFLVWEIAPVSIVEVVTDYFHQAWEIVSV